MAPCFETVAPLSARLALRLALRTAQRRMTVVSALKASLRPHYLWAHWKHHELPNVCPKDFAQLSMTVPIVNVIRLASDVGSGDVVAACGTSANCCGRC